MNNQNKNAEGYHDPTPYEALKNVKSPQRQVQGALAKIAGKRFEDLIDYACEDYKNAGRAKIEKTPEPMRPIKNVGSGKFTAIFTKQAQPDYQGTLCGGRSVVFEAKHTDNDRIEQSRVTEEQTKALNHHQSMGAICFVLVSMGSSGYYRVPWDDWQSMKEKYKRKYMTADELQPYSVLYRGGVLLFLNGLRGCSGGYTYK